VIRPAGEVEYGKRAWLEPQKWRGLTVGTKTPKRVSGVDLVIDFVMDQRRFLTRFGCVHGLGIS